MKKLMCKWFGHKWKEYKPEHKVSNQPYIICKRCGKIEKDTIIQIIFND